MLIKVFKSLVKKLFTSIGLISENSIPNKAITDIRFSGSGVREISTSNFLDKDATNDLIYKWILNGEAKLISRFGGTELKAINNYIIKNLSDYNKWNSEILEELFTHSGVYPKVEHNADEFSQIYLQSFLKIDLLGMWHNKGEHFLVKTFNPTAILSELIDLEPFFSTKNWLRALENKKVLVIHPFTNSIEDQYKKKDLIFKNKLLPNFQLITLKAVQSLSGESIAEYENWKLALDSMKARIRFLEFDVAIIGAGAFGMPIGEFVKELGKTAIHLGGATQLIFGIRGKRWDDRKEYLELFNESWIYPSKSETPTYGFKVDGVGAYWK